MTPKIFTSLAILASAGSMLVAAPTPAESKEYIYSIIGFPKAVFNKPIHKWRDDVERVTEGRVKFKIPPTPLAPPPRLYDATLSGVTDAATQFNAFLQKRVPSVQVGQLPLLYKRADAHGVALWRTYNKFFAKKKEYGAVKLVGFYVGPAGYICSLKDTPITSVKTLQSMKMWSLPGYAAKSLQRLGVNVTPGPAVRIFPIVSKGIVDGYNALVPHNAYDFNILRYTKSCTEIPGGVTQATFSILINPKVWNGIAKKDQEALMSVSGETLAMNTSFWLNHHLRMNKQFVKEGRQIHRASPKFAAALNKAWKPLHDEWIATANKAGFDGKAAYDFFVAQNTKVAAELDKK